MTLKSETSWEFPSGVEVRAWHIDGCGLGLIPGQGTKILKAAWVSQSTKQNRQTLLVMAGHLLLTSFVNEETI